MNRARLFLGSSKIKLQDDHETEEYESNNGGGGIIRDDGTRTISIIGIIDEKQLAFLQISLLEFFRKSKPITLFICSPGGFVSEATAIYDLLKISPVPITTIGYGHLKSGGLLIYLAGRKRLILSHSLFRFHWAELNDHYEINSDFLKRENDYFMHIQGDIKKIIAENTRLSMKHIDAFLHDFKTLSAEEAVRYGLAHEIIRTFPINLPKSKRKK